MENIYDEIKKLHETILTLLKQYKQLQKENTYLKNEIESLKLSLQEKNNFIENAEEKTIASSLASMHSFDEKKQLQQKIDFYLKDIEQCLSLLNA